MLCIMQPQLNQGLALVYAGVCHISIHQLPGDQVFVNPLQGIGYMRTEWSDMKRAVRPCKYRIIYSRTYQLYFRQLVYGVESK